MFNIVNAVNTSAFDNITVNSFSANGSVVIRLWSIENPLIPQPFNPPLICSIGYYCVQGSTS